MNSKPLTLRRELWLAMTLLGVLIALPLCGGVYLFSDLLEQELLTRTVNDEADFILVELRREPKLELPQTQSLKVWLNDVEHVNSPPPFNELAVGEHHDIAYLQRRWHLLKRATEFGELTVAFDVSLIEQREELLRLGLIGCLLLALLLSFLAAMWLSPILARPVTRLAAAVRQLRADDSQPIAPAFTGEEVQQIASAVDALRVQQTELLERERLFTAAISHELRSPLATIVSSLEVAEQIGIAEPLRPALERAGRASRSLADVVDSLLFIAREQRHLPAGERINAVEIALECIELLQVGNGLLRIDEQQACEVQADPQHLRSVLVNLLRNALQHSDASAVVIEVTANAVTVRDSGSGLPPLSTDELLRPYVIGNTATSLQKTNNGSAYGKRYGLGLYIVSRICRHYGWSITAAANQPKGTVITITF